MRTVLAALLLLGSAARADREDPWVVADRDEFLRVYDSIASVDDPRWLRDAKELRRAYESGKYVEGGRARVEVHGIALQRGDRAVVEEAGNRPSRATVRVTRRGCGVVLVLCGHDEIDWRVELDKGVDLRKVLVYGKGAQRVRGVPISRVEHRDRVFVPNRREREYSRFASLVARRVPGRVIHTYVGRADPGNRVLHVGPRSDAWRRQMLLHSLRQIEYRALKVRRERESRAASGKVFPMIVRSRGNLRWLFNATVTGIVSDGRTPCPSTAFAVAVNPESGRRYYLDRTALQEYSPAGRRLATIAIPTWIGRAGWATDVVYDGRRRRLVIVTMMGQLAEYVLTRRTWKPFGEPFPAAKAMRFRGWGRHGTLTAMTWDARRDCFWALYVSGGSQRLRRFSAHGVADDSTRSFRLPVKVGSGPGAGVLTRMLGDKVAVLTVNWGGRRKWVTRKSFLLDPLTGRITGQHTLRNYPAVPEPTRDEFSILWSELNGPDCYSAIQRLGRGGDPAVDFLRAEWGKLPTIDDKEFRLALRELDSPDPGLRSRAAVRLAGAGPRMRGAIVEAIGTEESAEVRMALTWMLDEIDSGPDLVARLGHVLAAIGTPKAEKFRRELPR